MSTTLKMAQEFFKNGGRNIIINTTGPVGPKNQVAEIVGLDLENRNFPVLVSIAPEEQYRHYSGFFFRLEEITLGEILPPVVA